MNRREFTRLLAIGGAVPFVTPELSWAKATTLPPTPASPDEKFWRKVSNRSQPSFFKASRARWGERYVDFPTISQPRLKS